MNNNEQEFLVQKILNAPRQKHADRILALSDKLRIP